MVVDKHPQLERGSFEHLKLGRHKKYKVVEALQLAAYVEPAVLLPQIPSEVDWISGIASWPMYGNDRLGDCTCASAGHIIQALTPIKKEKLTPLSQVREAIRQQLGQQKKQEKMSSWVNGVRNDFKGKTTYQVGYAPPPDTNATTTR